MNFKTSAFALAAMIAAFTFSSCSDSEKTSTETTTTETTTTTTPASESTPPPANTIDTMNHANGPDTAGTRPTDDIKR